MNAIETYSSAFQTGDFICKFTIEENLLLFYKSSFEGSRITEIRKFIFKYYCMCIICSFRFRAFTSYIVVFAILFYARCDCKLWIVPWFYSFSYIIDDHLCLKCFISPKLSQIVCLINVLILVYQHAKCDSKLRKVLRFYCVFFGNFHIYLHVWNVITSSNFYKLCVKAKV